MALKKILKNSSGTPQGYELVAGGTLYADSPIGTITPFGGLDDKIPIGWLKCNGQEVSRDTYAELFAVIGTAFGVGDGSTTFNVPDLRETVPVGYGLNTGNSSIAEHDSYTIGEFKDDQFQDHAHKTYINGDPNYPFTVSTGMQGTSGGWGGGDQYNLIAMGVTSPSMRTSTTTHGKQLGVNYIIKAKMVAVPADFLAKVDEAVEDALAPIIGTATPTEQLVSGDIRYVKSGNVCTCYFNGIRVNTSEGVNSRILCSGLPHLASNAAVFFVAWADGNSCVMDIEIDGRLRDAGDTVLGNKGNIYGSFTYTCK